MNFFQFSNNLAIPAPQINTDFSFKNCSFEKFEFKNIKHIGGKFRFTNNTLGNRLSNVSHIIFEESQIFNADFSSNKFEQFTTFYNSFFANDGSNGAKTKVTKFYNNSFQKANFSKVNFKENFTFDKCDFQSTTWFENCKNIEDTHLKFVACEFKGFSLFNNSKLNKLNIDRCTFLKTASFTDTVYDSINLYEVKFDKGAFFEEIKIHDIENKKEFDMISNCDELKSWRRTFRTIKQELLKTDNKIDYNRFRVYEFNAYKQELKIEIKNLKKDILTSDSIVVKNRQSAKIKRDIFILEISEFFSDYGTDWKRALKMTFLFGFALYVPFFGFENCDKDWDLNSWQIFPIGFLRFFILTDFYSPLQDGKTYIKMDGWNHLFSWIIFILGKIVIAFGIYEMIQAFRKFKA